MTKQISAFFFLVLLTVGVSTVSAQTAKPMTNTDVVKMVSVGLGEDIVVTAIRGAAQKQFETSPNDLIKLKTAKVSDKVIAAMMNSDSAQKPAVAKSRGLSDQEAIRKVTDYGHKDLGPNAEFRLIGMVIDPNGFEAWVTVEVNDKDEAERHAALLRSIGQPAPPSSPTMRRAYFLKDNGQWICQGFR